MCAIICSSETTYSTRGMGLVCTCIIIVCVYLEFSVRYWSSPHGASPSRLCVERWLKAHMLADCGLYIIDADCVDRSLKLIKGITRWSELLLHSLGIQQQTSVASAWHQGIWNEELRPDLIPLIWQVYQCILMSLALRGWPRWLNIANGPGKIKAVHFHVHDLVRNQKVSQWNLFCAGAAQFTCSTAKTKTPACRVWWRWSGELSQKWKWPYKGHLWSNVKWAAKRDTAPCQYVRDSQTFNTKAPKQH